MFIMPVIVLFYQENGLSMFQIMLLQAIFSVSVLILGLGASFVSGSDSALLFESLKETEREGEYLKFEGRLRSAGNMSEAIAAILGGLLATISLRMPLYIETALLFAAIPLALSIVEPKPSSPKHPAYLRPQNDTNRYSVPIPIYISSDLFHCRSKKRINSDQILDGSLLRGVGVGYPTSILACPRFQRLTVERSIGRPMSHLRQARGLSKGQCEMQIDRLDLGIDLCHKSNLHRSTPPLIRFSQIAAITFDAGGTLIRPHPSVGQVYAEVLANHGIVADPDALDCSFHAATRKLGRTPRHNVSEASEKDYWQAVVKKTMGSAVSDGLFHVVFAELYETFASAQRWKLATGVRKTLSRAREAGFRLAVFSNSDRRFRKVFEGLDIHGFFEEIFLSSEIGSEKPDPIAFRHVESSMGLPPQRLLHVGDSIHHDADGAIAAGWNHLLIGSGVSYPPYRKVDSVSDLVGLFEDAPV